MCAQGIIHRNIIDVLFPVCKEGGQRKLLESLRSTVFEAAAVLMPVPPGAAPEREGVVKRAPSPPQLQPSQPPQMGKHSGSNCVPPTGTVEKPHCVNFGCVGLQKIRQQRSTQPTLRLSFQGLLREVTQDFKTGLHFQGTAVSIRCQARQHGESLLPQDIL